MKVFILLLSLIASYSANSFADDAKTGAYVCNKASIGWNEGYPSASPTQHALNTLGCDTTKPMTVTPIQGSEGNDYVFACCVHK